MKLNSDFITHTSGEQHYVVSLGRGEFKGIIKNNGTAAFICEQLKSDTTEDRIVEAMLEEYEVDAETAHAAVRKVVEKLRSVGAIDD